MSSDDSGESSVAMTVVKARLLIARLDVSAILHERRRERSEVMQLLIDSLCRAVMWCDQ